MSAEPIFGTARIARVVRGVVDRREQSTANRWLDRLPKVPAMESEVLARFTGRALVADVVAPDARARVHAYERVTFQSDAVPKFKHGQGLSEAEMMLYNDLQMNMAGVDGADLMLKTRDRIVAKLIDGIYVREDLCALAMMMDGLTYDALNIKISAGWGMPAALKGSYTVPWTTAGSATPVGDLRAMIFYLMYTYGVMVDRLEMSTPLFRLMIATTEYQNAIKPQIPVQLTFANINNLNLKDQARMAAEAIGVERIDLVDDRYWYDTPDGTVASAPKFPLNKVLLSSTSDDGNADAWDFAKAIVPESLQATWAGGGIIGGPPTVPQRGPFGYGTPADLQANPPGAVIWAVDRGFPRKHRPFATAVFTAAEAVTDPIPFADLSAA